MKSRCCAAWPQWRYRAALYFVLVWRWRRNRNSFVGWFQRVLSFNRSSTLFRIDEAFILRSSPNNYSFLDWRLTRAKKFLEWNIFLAWGGMKWPVQVQHHLLWSMLGGCTWFVTGLLGKPSQGLPFHQQSLCEWLLLSQGLDYGLGRLCCPGRRPFERADNGGWSQRPRTLWLPWCLALSSFSFGQGMKKDWILQDQKKIYHGKLWGIMETECCKTDAYHMYI